MEQDPSTCGTVVGEPIVPVRLAGVWMTFSVLFAPGWTQIACNVPSGSTTRPGWSKLSGTVPILCHGFGVEAPAVTVPAIDKDAQPTAAASDRTRRDFTAGNVLGFDPWEAPEP